MRRSPFDPVTSVKIKGQRGETPPTRGTDVLRHFTRLVSLPFLLQMRIERRDAMACNAPTALIVSVPRAQPNFPLLRSIQRCSSCFVFTVGQ